MRLGVDIGGTFTDVVLQLDDGTFRSWKVASTPPNFAQGVLSGIELVADDLGVSQRELLGSLTEFVHGTTVTTNLVLTRGGERVGLLTTRGFGDTYGLARQYRGHEQDPALVSHPTPLVPREDIEEIDERVDYRGKVVVELDEVGLRESVQRLLDKGIRSFAICFLWSFVNPMHEQRAKRIVLEMRPDAYLAASFEACPVMGEYERTST
jgi:N-methylhydantoinase A